MRLLLRILLPIAVLIGCSLIAVHTVANRVQPERRAPRVSVTEVEFILVERGTYTVLVKTRGTVRPRTESTLIPEVGGRVIEVSPRMRAGEFFEQGDPLITIDPRDYHAEVAIARAAVEQARSTLTEEKARGEQAQRDWDRLGEQGEPDALVLRKPQLAGARAAVSSAAARLVQTKLALERTVIYAPYAGRVLERTVEVGQYVTPGNILARIYAVDYVEARLPLTDRQLEFVEVPEIYRRETLETRDPGPAVRLSARMGSKVHVWKGRVVRAEGSIDTESRQLFVIAQVDDPYGKGPDDAPPLKIGQFVEAVIEGVVLRDVFVIPREAVRTAGEVLLIGEEDRLRTRDIEVVWSDAEHMVVTSGLADQERLVVTPVGAGMNGVKVKPRLRAAAPQASDG